MVELGNQSALVTLSSSALGDVDTGANRLCGPSCLVVEIPISGFDPPNLPMAENSDYTDKLALPICECLAGLGNQLSQVVSGRPNAIKIPEPMPAAGQNTATPSGSVSRARLSRAVRK
jgi:hypothetical protein